MRSPISGATARRDQVKARVLDVAYAMFAADGYEATTMTAIAEAAGVPRRTLFRHFGGKEQIALAYQDRILDHLVERLHARPEGEDGATSLMRTLLAFVEEMPMARAMALSDLLVRNPELRAHNLEKYVAIEKAAATVIAPRCPSDDPALEAEIVAGAVVAGWRIANERWFEGGRRGHPGAEAARTFALLERLIRHDRPMADD